MQALFRQYYKDQLGTAFNMIGKYLVKIYRPRPSVLVGSDWAIVTST